LRKIALFIFLSMTYHSLAQEHPSIVHYKSLLEGANISQVLESYKELFMYGQDSVFVQDLKLEKTDTIYFAETFFDSLHSDTPFNALKIATNRFALPLITGLLDTLLEQKIHMLFYKQLEDYRALESGENLLKKWYPKRKSSWNPRSGEFRCDDFWEVAYLDSTFLTIVNERISRYFEYKWMDSTWAIDRRRSYYFFNPNVQFTHYDIATMKEINLIHELTVKGGERKLLKYFKRRFRESFDATEEEYDVRIRFKFISIQYAIVDDELEMHLYLDKHDSYDKPFVKERNYHVFDFYYTEYPEVLPFFKEKYKDLVSYGWWSQQKSVE
jgi:hypothetical protein